MTEESSPCPRCKIGQVNEGADDCEFCREPVTVSKDTVERVKVAINEATEERLSPRELHDATTAAVTALSTDKEEVTEAMIKAGIDAAADALLEPEEARAIYLAMRQAR